MSNDSKGFLSGVFEMQRELSVANDSIVELSADRDRLEHENQRMRVDLVRIAELCNRVTDDRSKIVRIRSIAERFGS